MLCFYWRIRSHTTKYLNTDRLPKETGRKGVCRHIPGHPYLFGRFQIINSVSCSMKAECRVQVNVSIRYLSFARKSFFIGLLLLNIMTRRACGEIKEMCLPLLFFVMCAIRSWIVTPCRFCLVRMDFLWDPEVFFEIAKK